MTSFDSDPVLSIGSSQREWATELTRFVSDYGGARLRGTVLTMDDAIEQDFEVLVVDDIASYLSPRFIERIRRMHRRVVGVYDSDLGEDARVRLLEMGVDAVVDALAGPEEILRAVADVRGESEPAVEVGAIAPVVVQEDPFSAPNNVVAVVGHDQAIDVALAIADSLVGQGQRACLADVDTISPSLAQRLGLPLAPNLLTALDALVLLRGTATESLQEQPRGYSLLNGLPEAGEWDTIRPADVSDLLEELLTSFDYVVAKTNPAIEDLAQLSGRAGRFDVHRAVIGTANQIVVTSPSTPLGLTRLLGWIAQARTISSAPIHAVFHDAPRSVYQRGELSEELVRSFVPASITWLPADGRLARAVWNGEIVPAGSYLRAVGAMTAKVVARGAPKAVGA